MIHWIHLTNPHDAPSPHSKKWDEEERRSESESSKRYGSSGYGGYSSRDSWSSSGDSWRSSSSGGYGGSPTNWSSSHNNYPYKSNKSKKAVVIISCLIIIPVALVFLGVIDIPNLQIPDLTKIINSCQVYGTIPINVQDISGKITLQLCDDSNLTITSKINKSTEIQIAVYDSKLKNIYQKTFVGDGFEHIIPSKIYGKMGDYNIQTKVKGNYITGQLTFKVQ